MEYIQYVEKIIPAVLQAGKEIINIYHSDFEVYTKEDDSPLTQADLRSNALIEPILIQTGFPVLSEESTHYTPEERQQWETYWLLDPIDGTREFVNKTDEFCICVALIHHKKPVLGIIYAPVSATLYIGIENIGSYKIEELHTFSTWQDILQKAQKLPLQQPEFNTYTFLSSVSFPDEKTQAYMQSLQKKYSNWVEKKMGSCLKFAYFAEGKANEYSRWLSLNEWDIAAGHALVKFAGFDLLQFEISEEVSYNNPSMKTTGFRLVNTQKRL